MSQTQTRFDADGHEVNNYILRSIPAEEFKLLNSHLSHVNLSAGHVLHDPSSGIADVYFLNSGMAALIVETNSGKSVEVGIAGHEGMTGVCAAAGLSRTIHRAVVEIAGDGFKISAAALTKILASAPVFTERTHLFGAIQSMQIAQTAACNRLHSVHQRLARWLLMAGDRVGGATLSITHEFLSIILGTDRASVTERAIAFQARGAIRYSRGKLRILDRKVLLSDSCECYRALRPFNHDLGLA
jgi:CRP-like cAMP-binding protein